MVEYALSRWLILFLWIISWLIFAYSIYYQFRKASLTERQLAFKLTLYSCLSLLFVYTLIYRLIDIYIVSSSHYITGLVWSLMVGLVFYMYTNITGLLKTKSNNKYEVFIMFMLVYMSITGFGYFGILIKLSERFFLSEYLYYLQFQTNSYKGIKFIGYNFFYFALLYFISFIFERESS